MAEIHWYTPIILVSLLFMMMALSSAVDINAFIKRIKQPKGICIGLICQFGFLPLLAFALCHAFNFDYDSSVAFLLTATCPGGALSNFFAFTVGADLPLSIACTTASSLLSFAFIPLNSLIYIEFGLNDKDGVPMDWLSLLVAIFVLILGVSIGLTLAYKKMDRTKRIIAPIASVAVAFLIIFSFADNFMSDYPLWKVSWKYYIAPLTLTTVGWICGLSFSLLLKLPKVSAVSIGIETSNQNGATAIAILALSVSDPDTYSRVVVLPQLYMLLSWVVNGVFIIIFLKLGWVNQPAEDDESVTCCTLIEAYKKKMKEEKDNKAVEDNKTENISDDDDKTNIIEP